MQGNMEIPGREETYREELYDSLDTKYETSDLDVSTLSRLYKREHSRILLTDTEYLGIVDQRSITPESLEQSLTELMGLISARTGVLEALSNEPYVIILGITNEISTSTREFMNNDATEHDRKYPFDIYIVDVGAGTILGTGRKYAPGHGETLKKNHLSEPLN